MTTTTTMTTTTPVGRATFRHCLRAELIKIRTMRSTAYILLGTLLFAVDLRAHRCGVGRPVRHYDRSGPPHVRSAGL